MRTTKYEITVLKTRRDFMSLEDAAERFRIHPDLVRRFMDAGLIEAAQVIGDTVMLDPGAVHRIHVIQSLRCDLGINLAGIAVILELLDRLGKVQRGGAYGYQ